MLLKKTVTLSLSPRKNFFGEFEDAGDFHNTLLEILDAAKVEKLIVKVPANDVFDKELSQDKNLSIFSKGDYNFYILPDIEFVKTHNFSFSQYVMVYALEGEVDDVKAFSKAIADAVLSVESDNYLETAKFSIDMKRLGGVLPQKLFA